MTSWLVEVVPPGVEEFEGITDIGGEHITVSQHFVDCSERHAEIKIMERAIAENAIFPSLGVGDFFEVGGAAGVKRHQPGVAANEAVSFLLALEPFIAKQEAYGFGPVGADAI